MQVDDLCLGDFQDILRVEARQGVMRTAPGIALIVFEHARVHLCADGLWVSEGRYSAHGVAGGF